MFLVLEGIDGSGKETQVKLLAERLAKTGRKVEVLDFPDYNSEPGKKIGQYLNHEIKMTNEELAALYSEDRKLQQAKIRGWLDEGKVVIADRYAYSNLAYQLANRVDYHYLRNLDKTLIFPEMVFFIDTSVDEVIRRMDGSRKKDKYESNRVYLKLVSGIYKRLAEGDIEGFGKAKWIRIDGDKSIEEVHKEIWKYVEACLSG